MTATVRTQSGQQRLARKQRVVAEAIAEELEALAGRAGVASSNARHEEGARAWRVAAFSLRLRAAELLADAGAQVTR